MMKKLISVALAGAFSVSAVAAPDDLTALSKDLKIMETVFDTTLEQSLEKKHPRISGVEATYLKDQGVVFRFRAGHGRPMMRGFFGDFDMDIDIEELGALGAELGAELGALGHLMGEGEGPHEDIRIVKINGAEIDLDNMDALRDKLRELSLEQRDIGYEHREIVRRKRDIEFESKRADEKRQKELEIELVELDKELAGLKENKQELGKVVAKVRKKKEAARKIKVEKRKADRANFIAGFESSLSETICRYGAGLKALSNDEKVNVILEGFGENKTSGKKKRKSRASSDKIYVFSAKDVKSCVNDKIEPKRLLEKADVYSF